MWIIVEIRESGSPTWGGRSSIFFEGVRVASDFPAVRVLDAEVGAEAQGLAKAGDGFADGAVDVAVQFTAVEEFFHIADVTLDFVLIFIGEVFRQSVTEAGFDIDSLRLFMSQRTRLASTVALTYQAAVVDTKVMSEPGPQSEDTAKGLGDLVESGGGVFVWGQ